MRNKKNILCVVAHPDDEALGPGGTLIKHVSDGDKVYIIVLSEGEDSKINLKDKNSERLFNAKNWSKTAGTNLYKIFNFPDQKLDNIPQLEIVKKLEKSIEKVKPEIVYIHHPYDINKDHQIASHAALVSLRPISYHGLKPEIRAFETPSSTEQAPYELPFLFKPNFYVNIENVWEKKIEALEAYSKEIKKPPHPRSIKSIEALAIKRGSEAGFKMAEAFHILRKLWI